MRLFLISVIAASAAAATPLSACLSELTGLLGAENVITNAAAIPAAYNQEFASYVPAAMITPRSGADVADILNVADKHGVRVAVRSFAGHSYIGQSTIGSDGIVMNLRKLDTFEVEPQGDEFFARIGAGLPQIEIYSRLAMNSPPLGLAGGTCPSVGLSGLVSGGGEGMTSTFGGITSDRLEAARAVVWTDAGKYEEVAASQDLLFALRGGMGGNYGVVTEWTMRPFVVSNVVLFSYQTHPLVSGTDDAYLHTMVRAYTSWMRALPSSKSVWGMVKFLSPGHAQFVGQCFCLEDTCSSCIAAVEDLQESILAGTKGGYEVQDFGKAMWSWAGCTDWGGIEAYPAAGLRGLTLAELRAATATCMAYDHQQLSGPYKSKSLYMPEESKLDASFESTALEFVAKEPACATARCFIQLSYVGGAMIEEHPNSAFVHRTPGWHLQILVYWPPAHAETAYHDWSIRARDVFLPMSLGESYQNYLDSDLDVPTWSKSFFPREGVFNRLVGLKCRYNPKSVIDVPHAMKWMIPRNC